MRNHLFFIALTLVALSLVACKGGNKKGAFEPTSSGRPYELLVVVDHGLWERPAGRALFNVLDTDVPGLPQAERSFRIMYTAPDNYNGPLKIVRNIIVVDVQNIYSAPKMTYEKDPYAAPQMVLTIKAPDEASFEQYVTEQKQNIINFFTRAEMNRQIALLEQTHNDYVATKVKSLFDCDVWVPGELASSKQGEHFFWAGTNAATGDENFVIYSFPYTDKNTFTKAYFVHVRDSVMKANIPGSYPDSYMTTDSLLSDVRPISIRGEYALEMRGLWRVKGDMMGGPYVSHMRLDRPNQRIIVDEIFIYSPDKLKRNLVRRMEASLYTLRLPGELQKGTELPEVVITPN
ncbi:MAG: DUF4837 family protein [Prevotellaceae bacterium]|jgi:hypothetical protein|nr:DUF4837 family protein [Prevotellaceae bacterium]